MALPQPWGQWLSRPCCAPVCSPDSVPVCHQIPLMFHCPDISSESLSRPWHSKVPRFGAAGKGKGCFPHPCWFFFFIFRGSKAWQEEDSTLSVFVLAGPEALCTVLLRQVEGL